MLYLMYKRWVDFNSDDQKWRAEFMKFPPQVCIIQPRITTFSPHVNENRKKNNLDQIRKSLNLQIGETLDQVQELFND